MSNNSNNFLNDLDDWMLDALQKKAEEATTSHPSTSVEDGDQPASEGSRSAENTSDVKAVVPDSVDGTSESDVTGAGRGEKAPVQEMANAKATGEDPANETASVKGKPSDPGTAMPAKADMGEKYSAAQLLTVGDSILQDIASAEALTEKVAAADESKVETPKADEPKDTPAVKKEAAADEPKADEPKETPAEEKKEESEEKKEESEEMKEAEYAGKVAAAALIERLKQASAPEAPATPEAPTVSREQVIESIVKNASADATCVAEYLAMQKSAMEGDEASPEEVAALVDAAGSDGEAPVDPAAMAAAPEEVAPEAAGAEMGGEAGSDAEVEALVDALVEAGVSPEELMALADEQGAAGPDGLEAAPADAAPAEEAAAADLAAAEEPKVASLNKEAWNKLSKDQKKGQLAATLAELIG